MKDIYEIGEMPPIGQVPKRMLAQVIRQERFGDPPRRSRSSRSTCPSSAPHEVLVYVMAAGINYNNVWAALGIPVDVIKARQKAGEPEDFHIGGTDASGIVCTVGSEVTNVEGRRRGRHPLRHVEPERPVVKSGNDPMFARRSGSGATSRTGAASRSSRRCRPTSACRSRST